MGKGKSSLNRKYLMKVNDKCEKCIFCGKALRRERKNKLCAKHYSFFRETLKIKIKLFMENYNE